jgi:dihydrofolate synthase / folylpolyglutamate synthase
MTYAEAIQFLYGLQMFGANFGLENTRQLAALAGDPQEKLRFIHVAGTNGKGSTCAMLESIYRSAGLRVGLFTSPHLVSFRERIQVSRHLIPESEVARLVTEFRGLQSGTGFQPVSDRQDACPTLFEFATVMALKYFADQKCDLVIWETGLGGRLDATNIVTPLASVITNIAFDHQQWLGDTLEKIAAEKAGIIKPGIPVITATDEPSALAVIEKIAREKNAPLVRVGQASSLSLASKMPAPPLLGEHQKLNAAVALATVEVLQKQIPVAEDAIRAGLAGVNWPGRLQLVTKETGGKILLDGAHNEAGVRALGKALKKTFLKSKRTLILGVLQDKDWQRICETLAPLAARILAVPVASARTAKAQELAAACRTANPTAEIIVCGSLAEALKKTAVDDFVVITGSLYLVGEALELLNLSPAGGGEWRLNEWAGGVPPAYKLS